MKYEDIEDLMHLMRTNKKKSFIELRRGIKIFPVLIANQRVYVLNDRAGTEKGTFIKILLITTKPKPGEERVNSAASGKEILEADKNNILQSLFDTEEEWNKVKSEMEGTVYLFLSIVVTIRITANCPKEIREVLVDAIEKAVNEEEAESETLNKFYFDSESPTENLDEIPLHEWVCLLSQDGSKFIIDSEAEEKLFRIEVSLFGPSHEGRREEEEKDRQKKRLRNKIKKHLDEGGFLCLS